MRARKPSSLAEWQARLSPALSTGAVYAIFGVAYAVGNLSAARALDPVEYGRLALFLAVTNVALRIAPLGLDGMVNRYPGLDYGRRLVMRLMVGALPVAVGAAWLLGSLYQLSAFDRWAILAATLFGAGAQLAAALFQSRHRYGASAVLDHGSDLFVAVAGAVALVAGLRSASIPVLIIAAGHLALALIGSRMLRRSRTDGRPESEIRAASGLPFTWAESLTYAGIIAGALTMQALDRLVIPRVLSLEDLAMFGVLAVFTIAPLHMLQLGVERTLFPRLRQADGPRERVQILRREAITVIGLAAVFGILAVLLAPPAARLLLAGKYQLTTGLVAAAVALGLIRVAAGFARTVPAALGTLGELRRLNIFAWVGVGAGILGAIAGRNGGLAWVMLGTGAGWLVLVVAGTVIGAECIGRRDGSQIDSAGEI